MSFTLTEEIKEVISKANSALEGATPQEVIRYFIENYPQEIALASSLGAEDQVLTEMVTSIDNSCKIFTLDTGRLFPETYDLIYRTSSKYKIKMEVFFPKHEAVQQMVNNKGINLFFDSVANRKECCNTRKIEPLTRAFKGLKVWICGLRREQSITRKDMNIVEWDANNGLLKINPLIEWSEEQVWDYINSNGIPYNTLHDKSYPSIGCQPCTRAVMDGEDVRAGRWYWESPDTKECGLHKR